MSTYDDRPRTDAEEETVTVTSYDDEGTPTTHREPLAPDGQPIFPPIGDTDPDAAAEADADAGLRTDDSVDLRDEDVADAPATNRWDADAPDGPAAPDSSAAPEGYSAPDSSVASEGYSAPGGYAAPVGDDREAAASYTDPADTTVVPLPAADAPVADDPVLAEPVEPSTTDPSAAESSAAEPAHRVDDHDQAWLDLQGTFVDDPAQAVRQAGERVERELADFRGRLDSADTEALRTAFRQFRDLSAILR